MKNIWKKKVFTLVVTGLLVLSALTIGTAVISAASAPDSSETQSTDNTKDEAINNEDVPIDPEDVPTREEIMQKLRRIEKESKQEGRQRELDMTDPEIANILKGGGSTGSSSGEPGLRTDKWTKDQHAVDPVHDMGYKGGNVKVSLMDTGFDMAQPDLQGTHAVFEYNASTMPSEYAAYDGHPIAFDPVSLSDYLVNGEVTESASWFVDTSYEAQAWVSPTDGIIAKYDEKTLGEDRYKLPTTVDDGEMVKFGLHPDRALQLKYGEKPAVLVTQDDTGAWSNVYTDLDNDRSFRDEKTARINGSNPTSEVIAQDVNGDGIDDISGGMVYFVSDGTTPLPYSQNFRRIVDTLVNLNLDYAPPGTIFPMDSAYHDSTMGMLEYATGSDAWQLIVGSNYTDTPGDGDVTCLMGDFNGPGSYGAHGTWTASAVAGQGVTGEPGTSMDSGMVQGLAPNASIVPMGNFFGYSPTALSFYDVNYASLFFATEGYDGNVSTLCDQAQIASSSFGNSNPENVGGHNYYDRLMDYAATQHSQNTLFVNSEGNEGHGFGTMGAPAGAQGILSVGASTNSHYRVDEWNDYDGGPNPWYGEVSPMSSRGPDAIGAHGPDVLANGQYGYGGDPLNNHAFNETSGSFDEFNGEDAYYMWSGTSLAAPNAAGVATLVYQAYMENHGTPPTAQTVKHFVMQGADDIKHTPFAQGAGFANATKAVKLAIGPASSEGGGLTSQVSEWRPGTNPGMGMATEHNVNLMKPGEYDNDTVGLSNGYNATKNYEISPVHLEKASSTSITVSLNTSKVDYSQDDAGYPVMIFKPNGDIVDMDGNVLATLSNPDADLLRFGSHVEYATDTGSYVLSEYHDWTDVNGNGEYDGESERNRIDASWVAGGDYYPDMTSSYLSIHEAFDRAHDGIVYRLEPNQGAVDFDYTLNIEQYNQESWDWITASPASGTIGALNSTTFSLNASVPADAPQGMYEGKILVKNVDDGLVSVIPTTITVGSMFSAADSERLQYNFGSGYGNYDHEDGIYRNDRVYGNWEGSPPRNGDWRYYYFTINGPTVNPVSLNLHYDNASSNIEAYLMGPPSMAGTYTDAFSYYLNPLRYGMYQQEVIASTDNTAGNVGMVTDSSLMPGTYMVAVHSKQIAGDDPYEEFSGEVLVSSTTLPDEFHGSYTVTNQSVAEDVTSGSIEYLVKPGYNASDITTFSKPPTLGGTDVYNMEATAGNAAWETDLSHFITKAKHQKITCVNVKKLHIEITATEAGDLDLGLIKDMNGNQKPDLDDKVVASHGIGGSMEHITLQEPDDGTYFVAINSYTADAGDPITFEVTKSVVVPGIEWNLTDVPSSFTAGETTSFNLEYELPMKTGAYSVWMAIGTENSPRSSVITGTIELLDGVPGELVLNENASTMPVKSSADKLIFEYHDPVFYSGMNKKQTEVLFDGTPIPSEAYVIDTITDRILVDAYAANALMNKQGKEYTVQVKTVDAYGNSISSPEYNVRVDGLQLNVAQLPEVTNTMALDLSGSGTPGAEILVNGEDTGVMITDSGSLIGSVVMEEGENTFVITAYDEFGNSVSVTRSVMVDITAPTVEDLSYSDVSHEPVVEVTGKIVNESHLSSVYVGGTKATMGTYGQEFSAMVHLHEGENTVTIEAVDMAGNVETQEITVNYKPKYVTHEGLNETEEAMQNDIDRLEAEIQSETDDIRDQQSNLESDIEDSDNDVKDLRSETDDAVSSVYTAVAGVGIGLLVILIIGLIAVYWMLNNKIEGMGGGETAPETGAAAPVEEEPMYEEPAAEEEEGELFEEPEEVSEEEEEELFEEPEEGEEELFEEEEPEEGFEEEQR